MIWLYFTEWIPVRYANMFCDVVLNKLGKILHAISQSKEDSDSVTIPTSRTITKENQKKVIDELNIHSKAQELAMKALELKKQRRKIDSSISKVESQLCGIFDDEKIDCLEIELGVIVRRKTDTGYEWGLEI